MALVSIVGGAGFIGSRLTAALVSAGYTVRVVDLVPAPSVTFEWRQADVRDALRLRRALHGSDIVYNLAAVHHDDVKPATLYDQVNVAGARNVCAACEILRINTLVFTSSVAVYGNAPSDAREEHAPAPIDLYGRSKLHAERVHREWQSADQQHRCLVIVRPTVVFGEGNRGNVYQILRMIAARRFVMIGDGTNRKSIAYVGNLSVFLARATDFAPGAHTFNYVDKPDLSMQAFADVVYRALEQRPITRLRIPYSVGYVAGLVCDLAGPLPGSGYRLAQIASANSAPPRHTLRIASPEPVLSHPFPTSTH